MRFIEDDVEFLQATDEAALVARRHVFHGPFKLERLDFRWEPVHQADMRPARAFALGVFGAAADFAIVLAEALDGIG